MTTDPWVRVRHLYRTRAAVFSRTTRILFVNLWLTVSTGIITLATLVPAVRLLTELPAATDERDTINVLVTLPLVNLMAVLAAFEVTARFRIKLKMVRMETEDD